jgi:hypothetical protein
LVAVKVAPAMQQRQKRRRESRWRWGKVMASSFRDAADVEALMSAFLEVNARVASARDPSA